jgi:processive 1,2-diacylglycerol beta-glucosyltransferase
MKKKILVLYTSSGYGHKKIGENIADVLKTEHDVDVIDLFAVVGGKLASRGTKAYLFVLKNLPGLWEFFYTNKLFLYATLPLRTVVARFKAMQVANLIINKHYDVIITTQVTASAIVSYLKKKDMYQGRFVVTFSDFHLHPYWLFDNVDFYLANVQEQKDEMVAQGIRAEKIAVCGITIPEPKLFNKEELRK